MAKVNIVTKKVNMELNDIIKYQLITHCYIHNVKLNNSELDCLTLLSILGNYDLADFCIKASYIFKNTQSARNCIVRLEKHNLITKELKDGYTKKKNINVNPNINVQTSGNILLDYKLLHIATT